MANPTMPTPRSIPAPRQRGITLIESLIALIVAALGILGIVGVQMRTLTDTQTSVRRAQAIRLIEDLGERLRVAPNALQNIDDYALGYDGEVEGAVDCTTSACSNTQLIKFNLETWKQSVSDALPLGKASIFLAQGEADGNRRQLGVVISWRENERHDADDDYRDAIDAVAAADDAISDANACPEDRICHLQYIPIAARCAPYATSSADDFQYFCPGA